MFKTSLRGAAENMELTWQASTFPSVYPAQSIRDVISPLYMQELLHLFVLIMGTGASLRVSGECTEEEDAEGSSFSTLGILIMSHYTCGIYKYYLKRHHGILPPSGCVYPHPDIQHCVPPGGS